MESRIVLEGSKEQIELLKGLLEERKDLVLPQIKEDYQTENLWSIEDVTSNYDCDDETAMKILNKALTNWATMDQIWLAIDVEAEGIGVEYTGGCHE